MDARLCESLTKEVKEIADSTVDQLEQEVTATNAERAAQYTEYEKNLGFWESLRIYWRASLCCLYGMLVVFNFGMDSIIAGYLVSVPKFREDYGVRFDNGVNTAYVIPATWLAIFSGVSQVTAIIGALFAGWVADRIGRRWATAASCLISVAGVAAQYWSNKSLGILSAGKAINGLPIGAWLVLGPLYASEVAPIRLRGVLTAMTNSTLLAGIVLFTGVMYELGSVPDALAYMIPFACQWIIPGFILLTFWFWPESPVWLVRVGRRDEAIKTIAHIYGSHSLIDKEGLLAQIEETIALERSQMSQDIDRNNYKECFEKRHRHRTLIVMFVYCCQYLSGNTLVIGYQTYFYQLLGYTPKYSMLLGLIHSIFMWVNNIVGWTFIANFRRRILIVWGQFAAAICLFIIGWCSIAGTPSAYTGVVAFVFIWAFFYQTCLATVGWTVGTELPALRMRARTQGLANVILNFTLWVVSFSFPYMFNPDAANLGGKVGFVFGGTTFIGFLGTFFFLPETKDRTPAELDILFDRGIPARKFHKVKVEDL